MSAKRLTNIRLSEGERWQMKRLAARLGLSESRTVARALDVLQTYLDGQPLRATPPAKEPVSVDGVLETCKFDGKPLGLWVRIPYDRQDNGDYDHGYRVRVVKIEEEQQ